MHETNSRAHCTRRAFVGGGVGLLTFVVGGCERQLTPAQARAANAPLRTLSDAEVRALEALGEILLPGSVSSGLAHFIDHQLSGAPADSMLMVKYLGVAPPFTPFYRNGLAAAENAARTAYSRSCAELDQKQGNALVLAMAQGKIQGWSGPPASLFYFTLRNDAVDVMYGTQTGFQTLAVPYMAHIAPPSRWGE